MTITTLIPAFKPKYLRDLLIALQHQTLRPERIIVSDDSPDRAFRTLLLSEPLKSATASMNIEVIDGPRAGGLANCRHLLKAWNGSTELVHLLFDDDVIYPDFYAAHRDAHASGQFDCSISRRWTALESGQPVGQLPAPDAIAKHPHRVLSLQSDLVFMTTIPGCNNWFGEFSNAVLNRDAAAMMMDTRLAGISYEGLGDVGMFLAASLKKPLCLINEPLGYFRTNPAQATQQTSSHAFRLGILAWAALAIGGMRVGKLRHEHASGAFRTVQSLIHSRFAHMPEMLPFADLMRELIDGVPTAGDRFVEAWHAFIPDAQAAKAAGVASLA
ncbi:glycosyltransferase family A protein [Paraburkholderia bannensis]|uniref:glycosyltransferase family A protein n=1 Tax=Paraburkholderia bannensis TaxID=765414 RepID=UPI002ABE302C|nr:glycosyltransferase family A protein [Paraburkholderia bannensis]